MPQIYETTPITPSSIYLDTHQVDNWWGTVLPQFVRLDLGTGNLFTTNPIQEANQAKEDLASLNPVKAVSDYLEQNQLNYIVGGVGLVLIAAAIFQIVKPIG